MWRTKLTGRRLLALLGLLIAIAIAFELSVGNYEVGNPTTPTGPTTPATSTAP